MKIYRNCWKILKRNKRYFYAVSGIFLMSLIIGLALPVFFNDFIQKFVEETMEKTENLDFLGMLVYILWNNIFVAFLGIVLGVFFGIVPLLFSFFNGYVLGFVMNKTSSIIGIGVFFRLLPHGIFEIPALVLSLGTGLSLGFFIFRGRKDKKRGFWKEVKDAFKIFVFVILPLLLIAGLIETWLIFAIR